MWYGVLAAEGLLVIISPHLIKGGSPSARAQAAPRDGLQRPVLRGPQTRARTDPLSVVFGVSKVQNDRNRYHEMFEFCF